jgi:uncharacterized protein YcgI (DUF1989 family)
MPQRKTVIIAPRSAKAFHLEAGSKIRLINTFGAQVVAAWAFVPSKTTEYMSIEQTRIHAHNSRPQLGTLFYTNFHTPILEMTEDSSPGVHDWYLAACNKQRFEMLGHEGEHASCEDNLYTILKDIGHSVSFVPCPLNLFENVSFLFGNPMAIKEPVAMPGDYVCLKAQIDCLVVLSACPQDIALTNGPDHVPRSVEVEITNSIAE